DNYGQEFVYPKYRAVELAQQTGQPVPSMAEGTEQNSEALEQASVNNEGQSEVAENTPASANSTSDNTSDNTTPASTTPASTLPKTASDMPLAALGGMLLLGLGICLRLLSRKSA
ncbi:MAG: LPXTG cell wall anchor domain-containing protein, partial [Candidatus Acidiferrales bacterium]